MKRLTSDNFAFFCLNRFVDYSKILGEERAFEWNIQEERYLFPLLVSKLLSCKDYYTL